MKRCLSTSLSRIGGYLRFRAWRRAGIALVGTGFFLGATSLLWPLPESFVHPRQNAPSRILDRYGTLLYEIRDPRSGDRDPIALDRIPKIFVQAVLDTEDRRYHSHPGIDPLGMLRAAVQNLSSGRVVSGASTITQQLVRIRNGSRPRGLMTKLLEMRDALRLEMVLSKDEILEAYLNGAYFGHQAYGAESAARTYFGKNLTELSLSEATLLAGLVQSPSAYDPYKAWDLAKKRQAVVLNAMVDAGDLSVQNSQEALQEEIRLRKDRVDIKAPHFVFFAQDRAPERFTDGNTVRTTIDEPLQQETERIVRQKLEMLKEKNVTSAAVVVLDARTGDVLTMVGSADYFDVVHDGAVNVATSLRQPGSALKPFTYALALLEGDTLSTTVADTETRYFTEEGNPYTPRNYDYEEHGLVRYREALANSYNIAAVKVLERVGVDRLLRFLKASGITTLTKTPDHYGLALTLGDAEVRLLELTQAYGIFARGGLTLPLRVFADDPVPKGENVLEPGVAWLIDSALSDDEARMREFGKNSPLHFSFPAGAKTGTTRNGRDNWAMGFTPDRIVGVWVGNPDNTAMRDISGITGAAPIMHDVLIAATEDIPRTGFMKPPGIVEREVCRLSGKLPTPACRERVREYFIAGTEPTEQDDLWKIIRIDRRNGLLAGPTCPAETTEEKTVVVFPAELRSWANDHGWPMPPARPSPLCPNGNTRNGTRDGLSIAWPHDGDMFELDPLIPDERETVTLRAQADSGVSTIEWFVDGNRLGEAAGPDYAVRWNPRPGVRTIEARTENAAVSIRVIVTEK